MKLALLGRTLGHSLSPEVHAVLAELTGIPSSYELEETEPDRLEIKLQEMKEIYRGWNVTIPYKRDVIPWLDSLSPEAERLGAVNTVAVENGHTRGYNTDMEGFRQALLHAGLMPEGRPCTVLGSGGAAEAVCACLKETGAGPVTVVSRNPSSVTGRIREHAGEKEMRIESYKELEEQGRGWLLINCTPVGMMPREGVSPVPESVTARFSAAADLIYNPSRTAFLKQAERLGLPVMNGMYMLAAQAAAAREIWTGRSAAPALVEETLRRLGQS
jgi:shikimate dehydrogenase